MICCNNQELQSQTEIALCEVVGNTEYIEQSLHWRRSCVLLYMLQYKTTVIVYFPSNDHVRSIQSKPGYVQARCQERGTFVRCASVPPLSLLPGSTGALAGAEGRGRGVGGLRLASAMAALCCNCSGQCISLWKRLGASCANIC